MASSCERPALKKAPYKGRRDVSHISLVHLTMNVWVSQVVVRLS